MPPSRPSRLRKLAGFAGLSLAAVVGGAVFAGAASAHHPDVSGVANCDATITFTSTAWAGPTDASRTNPEIEIAMSVDGGAYAPQPQKASYAFNPTNHFSFGDTLTPPPGWHTVTLRARALVDWGNGTHPNVPADDRFSAPIVPKTGCTTPAQPSATIADASCDDHGAVVTLENEGGEPVDFDVNGETVAVGPDETVEHTVTFPGDTATTITVTAPGMDDVVRDVDHHCAAPAPAATVADASCADSGAIVHLVNTGDAPAEFTIHVPGSPDQTVTVPANSTADQAVALPAGSTTTVTVSSASMDDVVKDVSYTCAPTPPPTPPAETPVVPAAPEQPVLTAPEVSVPASPETPEASVPVAGSATAEVSPPAPTTSIPGEVLAAEATAPAAGASSGTLPFTGDETGSLTLVAFGSLLAGLALVFAGRRRTQH